MAAPDDAGQSANPGRTGRFSHALVTVQEIPIGETPSFAVGNGLASGASTKQELDGLFQEFKWLREEVPFSLKRICY
jgi:hypothetical protein